MADVVDIPEFRAFYYTDDTPRQFYTLRRYEDESGSGKMHCYNIAPGIQLSFNDLNLSSCYMLVIMSMLWVAILTVLISAFSVIWKDKAFDHATRVICIIGICVPSFWLALILLIAFAVEIPIFSVISDGSIKSLILPSISIAIPIACISIRVLRAAVINELKSDYVTYAKARGFSTSKIVYGEVLRNAFPSAITLFAQYCASVFGTSALIETVFSIQGLGYYLTEACESMDVYGISGVVLICAILFVLFNTAADIFSGIICPAYRRKRV